MVSEKELKEGDNLILDPEIDDDDLPITINSLEECRELLWMVKLTLRGISVGQTIWINVNSDTGVRLSKATVVDLGETYVGLLLDGEDEPSVWRPSEVYLRLEEAEEKQKDEIF